MLWMWESNKCSLLISRLHLFIILLTPHRMFPCQFLSISLSDVNYCQIISMLIFFIEIYKDCRDCISKLDLSHTFPSLMECFEKAKEYSFDRDLLKLVFRIYIPIFWVCLIPFFLVLLHLSFIFLFSTSYFIMELLLVNAYSLFLVAQPPYLPLQSMFIFWLFL